MSEEFSLPIRVYIEDTDAGGIVFYANYLKFMERARTEMIRESGYEIRSGLQDGVNFVVSGLSIDYRSPARLDDLLLSRVRIARLGKSRIVFDQRIVRAEDSGSGTVYRELAVAEVVVGCVSLSSGKPVKMPVAMRDALLNKM
ncbi:MAG: 4-hydroxybenzoyl-CoA thioesterase [Proteobacteria bacterium]|nr:MAG: 4-hydroxybenzoyl-CoA thioesterase [Pseudomonadota bacterium]